MKTQILNEDHSFIYHEHFKSFIIVAIENRTDIDLDVHMDLFWEEMFIHFKAGKTHYLPVQISPRYKKYPIKYRVFLNGTVISSKEVVIELDFEDLRQVYGFTEIHEYYHGKEY